MDKLFIGIAIAATAFIAGVICAPKPEIVRATPPARSKESLELEEDVKWMRENPEVSVEILKARLSELLDNPEVSVDAAAGITQRITRLQKQIHDAKQVAEEIVEEIVDVDSDDLEVTERPKPAEKRLGDDCSMASKH